MNNDFINKCLPSRVIQAHPKPADSQEPVECNSRSKQSLSPLLRRENNASHRHGSSDSTPVFPALARSDLPLRDRVPQEEAWDTSHTQVPKTLLHISFMVLQPPPSTQPPQHTTTAIRRCIHSPDGTKVQQRYDQECRKSTYKILPFWKH